MTNEKESRMGKIIVFLDGKTRFSVNDNLNLWKSKEKISIPRKSQMQTEVLDSPVEPSPALKTIESKVVAKIEMTNSDYDEILCLLCYELVESTRSQVMQDIIKIKQDLLK